MIGLFLSIKSWVVISLSFVLMMLLMLAALPAGIDYFQPQLVVLALIYWLLNTPQHVGIAAACFIGIALDVLYNAPLGMHAWSLVMVAFVVLKWRVRINFFVAEQKLALVFFLVVLYFVPQFCFNLITEQTSNLWLYCVSPFISAIIWPYFAYCFDLLRRKFNLA